MYPDPLTHRDLSSEFTFRTSRSSGAGGQNVNKVSTRVELMFPVSQSVLLTEEEKSLMRTFMASRIDTNGVLHMTCQESRSQLKNKQVVVRRFYELLARALKKQKERKATKPSKAKVQARLDSKKLNAEKKQARVKIRLHWKE